MCTLKRSLDPLQNRAQSSCHNTVNLYFRLQAAWQSIFDWVFLQISHRIMAWILKQSCSPIIGLQTCCGHFGQIPYILKDTGLQSWAQYTEIRLSQKSSNVTLLQISPKLMVSFANLQICEPYDLRYPNSLVFALRSKSVQNLHITP